MADNAFATPVVVGSTVRNPRASPDMFCTYFARVISLIHPSLTLDGSNWHLMVSLTSGLYGDVW